MVAKEEEEEERMREIWKAIITMGWWRMGLAISIAIVID